MSNNKETSPSKWLDGIKTEIRVDIERDRSRNMQKSRNPRGSKKSSMRSAVFNFNR